MTSVTCGLTAEERDKVRNPTLYLSMGLPLLFYTRLTEFVFPIENEIKLLVKFKGKRLKRALSRIKLRMNFFLRL